MDKDRKKLIIHFCINIPVNNKNKSTIKDKEQKEIHIKQTYSHFQHLVICR